MNNPHDDFRKALEALTAAFEAVQLAPSVENIMHFENACWTVFQMHRPVGERAKERVKK